MIIVYSMLAAVAYIFIGGFIFGLIDVLTDMGERIDREVWMIIWPIGLAVLFIYFIGWMLSFIYDFGKRNCIAIISYIKTRIERY